MTTYYVDTNADAGGDGTTSATTGANCAWDTIADVNGKAGGFSAGDSILFNRGCTWAATLWPPSSGSDGSPITFGAYGTGAKPIITGSAIRDMCIALIRDYITIENIHFTDSTYIGVWSDDAQKQDNIIIDSCDFDTTMPQGLSIHGDNCTVKNCTFTCSSLGIELRDVDNSHCQNFLIENNAFTNCGGAAVTNAGILLDGDTNGDNADYHKGQILRNMFTNMQGRAIDGFFGESVIAYNIIDTVTTGAEGSAIGLEVNGPDNEVYNNVLYECANMALMINNDPIAPNVQSIVKNNVLISETVNHLIWVTNDAGLTPTINNNVYWMGAGGETKYYWKDTDYTFTNWKTNSSQDANSVEANPLFVSPPTNFRLQAGSPCIDAGVDVGLTTDYSGNSVPSRLLPDIGAYEYIFAVVVEHPVVPKWIQYPSTIGNDERDLKDMLNVIAGLITKFIKKGRKGK